MVIYIVHLKEFLESLILVFNSKDINCYKKKVGYNIDIRRQL